MLNRAGFGGSPEDVERFHAMGREQAVEFLLKPEEKIEAFPPPKWADLEVAMEKAATAMAERVKQRREMANMTPAEAANAKRSANKAQQMEQRQHAIEAQGWWFRRMLVTQAPLREKMTLFWHDHFATSFQKVKMPVLLMKQNGLFREHATGNFRELTQKVVRDPAMMLYLDTGKSNKENPNENFAREVMELFTLGEGNYTEEDVKEVARAFTGYRLNRLSGEVTQSRNTWDGGEKKILGSSGKFNGTDVVKLIFKTERCAEFMAEKIWEYFAYESPSPAALKALGKILRDADYEVAPVLREIFLSKEFYAEKSVGTQIKCPVQYLVQMLKELEMTEPPIGFPIYGQAQLGQILFMPPNVAGWDWGKAWVNTNTLLTRYSLAGNLTKGSFDEGKGGGKMRQKFRMRMKDRGGKSGADPVFDAISNVEERNDTEALVDGLITRFFSIPIPKKARQSFLEYAESKQGITFTDKELGELCHLMMSTPYYQLC